ncbi:MAG: ATP-binding protein [Planctomycetia bacterium]|nr:ATP-binding protein [Planctomycetia bacterium]
MASLTVIQGPDRDKVFDVNGSEATIGRDPSCEVSLNDKKVSRRHALLRQTGKSMYLKDLGSANGTFVNGAQVSETSINPGDQIRIGQTLMRLEGRPPGVPEAGGRVLIDTEGRLVDSAIKATIRAEESPHHLFVADRDADKTRTALSGLQAIYKISATIGRTRDVKQLLGTIMDMIFDVVDADRGFIMLADEETGVMSPVAVRYREELIKEIERESAAKNGTEAEPAEEKKSLPITVSQTIINYVMKRGEGVLSTNAMQDRRFADGESVHDFGIHSAICVPLKAHDRILGIIHVDMHVSHGKFSRDELRLMTAIGFQAGLAVENAQLMEATVQAERLAATGEAVASVSHYIKNILQGIQGGEHIIQGGLASEDIGKVGRGWQIVRKNQARIDNLVKNMLNFSHDVKPSRQQTSINSIVREVVELAREAAEEKKVQLNVDLDTRLPEISVDPEGIHHACLNILINAIDAVETIKGEVSIATKVDNRHKEMLIEFKDNGPGIPPERQRNIYEPFRTTKGHKGSGLGLAVAAKIIREHGGRITLQSQPGDGATFTIKLPRQPLDKPDN